jgi:hypothetical protein
MKGERWSNLLSAGLMVVLLAGLSGSAGFTAGAARAQASPEAVASTPLGTAFTYQG